MKSWQNYLLGIITAIVGGAIATVVAYYITRETPQKERLVYTIDQPVVFESGTNNFTLQNISIANLGDASAKNVQIVIDASHSGADIKDHSAVSSSGLASGIVVNDHSPKDVAISLNSLIPKEQIKASLLLTSKPKDRLIVSVKSDASLGTLESQLGDARRHGEKNFAEILPSFLSTFVAVLALASAVIGSFPGIRKWFVRPQRLSDVRPPR